MKKLICTLICSLTLLLSASASAFTCPTAVVDEAIKTGDFKSVFTDYFFPSLTPIEKAVFASELNISNGRKERFFGERHIFGKLMNAESAVKLPDPYKYANVAQSEVLRLLFGPWAEPGQTTLGVIQRNGQALNLHTGKWQGYSGQAILVKHTTEYFGGWRSRLLTLGFDGVNWTITILRTK